MPLEVINCALRYTQGALIGGLSESTDNARYAVTEYRKALRWLVEESEWNCQTITHCPDELPTPECCDIPQGFRYAFKYPDNALRIASVCYKAEPDCPQEDTPDVFYRIVKVKGTSSPDKAIVVNCKPIIVEYVCLPDDCDVENMMQRMRDALTYRMASSMFMVKGDEGKSEKYRLMAEGSLREAKEINARQQHRDSDLTCGFLNEARQW